MNELMKKLHGLPNQLNPDNADAAADFLLKLDTVIKGFKNTTNLSDTLLSLYLTDSLLPFIEIPFYSAENKRRLIIKINRIKEFLLRNAPEDETLDEKKAKHIQLENLDVLIAAVEKYEPSIESRDTYTFKREEIVRPRTESKLSELIKAENEGKVEEIQSKTSEDTKPVVDSTTQIQDQSLEISDIMQAYALKRRRQNTSAGVIESKEKSEEIQSKTKGDAKPVVDSTTTQIQDESSEISDIMQAYALRRPRHNASASSENRRGVDRENESEKESVIETDIQKDKFFDYLSREVIGKLVVEIQTLDEEIVDLGNNIQNKQQEVASSSNRDSTKKKMEKEIVSLERTREILARRRDNLDNTKIIIDEQYNTAKSKVKQFKLSQNVDKVLPVKKQLQREIISTLNRELIKNNKVNDPWIIRLGRRLSNTTKIVFNSIRKGSTKQTPVANDSKFFKSVNSRSHTVSVEALKSVKGFKLSSTKTKSSK